MFDSPAKPRDPQDSLEGVLNWIVIELDKIGERSLIDLSSPFKFQLCYQLWTVLVCDLELTLLVLECWP